MIRWDSELGRMNLGQFNTTKKAICIWDHLFKCLKWLLCPVTDELTYTNWKGEAGMYI